MDDDSDNSGQNTGDVLPLNFGHLNGLRLLRGGPRLGLSGLPESNDGQNYTEDYLILDGNFISASVERALVLYAKENRLVGSVPDMVFLTYMGRFYGSRDFLLECCGKTDQIVAPIIVENPDILGFWCNLKMTEGPRNP